MNVSSEPRDPGLPVPNPWRSADDIVVGVKEAVVSIRDENAWGPRNRQRVTFRASELGDLVAFRDKGGPGGCARKVFYSFWEDKYPRIEFDAETLLNFDKGNEAEDRVEVYLKKAGLYAEGQTRFGAWASCKGNPIALGDDSNSLPCRNPEKPQCGVSDFIHGDHRFPDRSTGLVRGKADFLINHPVHGLMPLEWKSCSTYVFDMVSKGGPKPENALQALFYAHEMGTTHAALGYTNKESGDVAIFIAPAQPDLMEQVFALARVRRVQIESGELPAMPDGARAAQDADPPGSRRSGFKKMPDEAYYDRAWPCYSYAVKKGRVMPCPFYEHCHGPLPEKPGTKSKPRANPLLKAKKARGPMEFS